MGWILFGLWLAAFFANIHYNESRPARFMAWNLVLVAAAMGIVWL